MSQRGDDAAEQRIGADEVLADGLGPSPLNSVFDGPGDAVVQIEDLLERHGAFALEKQDALADFLGEHDWWLDLPAGTVDFGQGRVYPIQLIGTESNADHTWLWAWANKETKIPEPLLRSATRLREFGVQEQVQALVEPELTLDSVDSHTLGLVAAGITGADAYYLGHHDRGAVLFLVSASELQSALKQSVLHMTTIFTTFISSWSVASHQRAFVAYARAKGCRVTLNGSRVACVSAIGEEIYGDFNEAGRLISLNTSMKSIGTT